ncbi:MAG: ATP-dependent metallopeptidase FtsH/Yme1/Tma family protein, partial [Patescibacteria group bacterium]
MDLKDFNKFRPGGDDKKGSDGGPAAPSFFSNILTILLVFLLLVSAYSFFAERNKNKTEVLSLSQLATDIRQAQVAKVDVEGADLNVEYGDGTKKESKKEIEASFSETMKNYGVLPEELASIRIEIKDPCGFSYWFYSL